MLLLLCKQSCLPLRVLDTLAGDIEVFRLYLDADELAAEIHAGDAGRAAAHEGVEEIF